MQEENGQELPTVVVAFHPGMQAVKVAQKGFTNPGMVKAVLQMALDEVDSQMRLQKAVQLQHHAVQEQQAADLARKLRGN